MADYTTDELMIVNAARQLGALGAGAIPGPSFSLVPSEK